MPQETNTTHLTVYEALRLFLDLDYYPILGNEDLRAVGFLARKVKAKAALAVSCPDDPPEYREWLQTLLSQPPLSSYESVLDKLYERFEPEEDFGAATPLNRQARKAALDRLSALDQERGLE